MSPQQPRHELCLSKNPLTRPLPLEPGHDNSTEMVLGRAPGWGEACDLAIACTHEHEECQRCRGYYWMYQWHCFIQALADGNTPEAFFTHLTSSQTRSGGTKHRHQACKAP